MVKTGKNFLNAKKAFEGKHDLSLDEAVNLVKNNASAKFDETVDIAINLGVDPKHADQMVRGVCALPHGNGKNMKVAVFAKGEKAEEAKKAGADIVGAEDLMETIQSGAIDFDRCIATPDMMAIVGRLGKVSFDKQKISENITAFIESVNKAKPTGAKGAYLKRISVSSTMGPSITLDSSQFAS